MQSSVPATRVLDALSDDLNTPLAFKALHELADELSDRESQQNVEKHNARLSAFARALELLGIAPVQTILDAQLKAAIVRLVEDRLVARHTKNWKESDRIRDELDAMGITIKDHKDGTTSWEVKR